MCLPRQQLPALFHLPIHQWEQPFSYGCVEHVVRNDLSGLPQSPRRYRSHKDTGTPNQEKTPPGTLSWSWAVLGLNSGAKATARAYKMLRTVSQGHSKGKARRPDFTGGCGLPFPVRRQQGGGRPGPPVSFGLRLQWACVLPPSAQLPLQPMLSQLT